MSEPTIHYANPDETVFTGAYFIFRFGANLDTHVCVIQRPDHFDSALEIAAEWLEKNEPDVFSEPLYQDAHDERDCTECTDGSCEACAAAAETDHTYTEAGWLLSEEWRVDEHQGEPFETPSFDRFDICTAYASYWSAWHMGQNSDGYARMCKATEICSNAIRSFDDMSENAKAIYRKLVLSDGR